MPFSFGFCAPAQKPGTNVGATLLEVKQTRRRLDFRVENSDCCFSKQWTISRQRAMLPQARRRCSSCLRFIRKPPVDLPALPGRKDPAEWAALPKATPLFPRIEQDRTDRFPLHPEDAAPFLHSRRGGLPAPALARHPGALEPHPGGIPVDGLDNGLRQRQAPLIDLFVRFHGYERSTSENSDQLGGIALLFSIVDLPFDRLRVPSLSRDDLPLGYRGPPALQIANRKSAIANRKCPHSTALPARTRLTVASHDGLTCLCVHATVLSVFAKKEGIVERVVRVVFEKGVLKPLSSLRLRERSHYMATIYPEAQWREEFEQLRRHMQLRTKGIPQSEIEAEVTRARAEVRARRRATQRSA